MTGTSVIGAGMTKFGVHEKSLADLFADAAFPALDDAGVATDEIDAFYLGNAMGGMTENDTHLAPKIASHIGLSGIPCQRFEDACATSANAFKHGVRSVQSGENDVVLVGGVERCSRATGIDTKSMTNIFMSASHRLYEQPSGLTFPGVFALMTKRHMYEYGTTEEQLAEIAIKNHYHGSLNPRAHFGRDITVSDVLESPIVADPFRLLDCCPFSDGASAVVVTRDDAAASYDGDAVRVAGVGHATDIVPLADKPSPTSTQAARDAAQQAYDEASITADDIDVAEVHDCFTGAEVMATEALGLFETGDGGPAAAAGRSRIDGDRPVNPSGGLKAKGHPIGATGTAQLFELTTQLRGTAGDRQIDGARRGVSHNLGGDAATTLVTVLEVAA